MQLNWRASESTEKPLEVDTEISTGRVFVRRNIIATDKDGTTYYQYEEAKLSKEDCAIYLAEQNASYLSDISDAILEMSEIIYGGVEDGEAMG